jgi:hypothetical protein
MIQCFKRTHTVEEYVECFCACYPVVYDIYFCKALCNETDEIYEIMILTKDCCDCGVALHSIQFYTRSQFGYFPSLQVCPSLSLHYHRHHEGHSKTILEFMKSEIAKNLLYTMESNEEVEKMLQREERQESERELKNLTYYSLLSGS